MDISSETLNTKVQFTYQMTPKKKKGEVLDPEKACSSIVGGLPGQRSRSGSIGEWAEGRGLRELMGRGESGKGKSFGM